MVSACASGSGGAPIPESAIVTPGATFRAPQVQRAEGLDSVIGKGAGSLTRRFGDARIDLSEGDARKLQFISSSCVLDIFLYPLKSNAAPVATHVEARRRVGGGSADRAGCIAEVEHGAADG